MPKKRAGFSILEAKITLSVAIAGHHAAPLQPRARGGVELSAKATERGTALDGLRQAGSLKCLFPRQKRAPRAPLEAVLVNTAGGITGGDHFTVAARARAGVTLTLTTQAAERAYRAQSGETGRLETRLTAEAGARLTWLPQETILFDGCALDRSLHVTLDPGASLLLAEPLVFGRAAMGEALTRARFTDRIEIRRAGTPVYLDALRLSGDVAAHLARPHVGAGAGAMVSLVYLAPNAEAHLAPIRAMLPGPGGVSLIREDLLALRLLAADSFVLRQSLIPVLRRLTQDPLPRSWMI